MGRRAVAQALLAAGAGVSVRCHSGKSALDMAIAKGHVDIARAIIDHGADVNAVDTDGSAPLHTAIPIDVGQAVGRAVGCQMEVVSLLLASGANANVLDGHGQTSLHRATMEGYTSVARALLAARADVNLRCHRGHQCGRSALDIAVAKGFTDMASLMITHGADADALADDPPINVAAVHNQAEMVPLLLAKGTKADGMDGSGYTPLQIAAIRGHVAVTRALLAADAKVGIRYGYDGCSALDIAAFKGHVKIVAAIIEHGADVNSAARGDGSTPLHCVARGRRTAVIDVLVQAGANIEQENGEGETPLHLAAKNDYSPLYACTRGPAAVLVLLKHGASASKQNADGETPLYFAATTAGTPGTAEVVDILLRHGANEKIFAENGQSAADVVGSEVYEWMGKLAEDVERVRKLLANAPADRAWRRRDFLVLCRAHYPSGRVQFGQGSSHAHDTGIAKRTPSHLEPSKAEVEWAGVASMLMGDGADIIFETIVGFL